MSTGYGEEWSSTPQQASRGGGKTAQLVIGALLIIIGIWVYWFNGWSTIFGTGETAEKYSALSIIPLAVGVIVFVYGLVGRSRRPRKQKRPSGSIDPFA